MVILRIFEELERPGAHRLLHEVAPGCENAVVWVGKLLDQAQIRTRWRDLNGVIVHDLNRIRPDPGRAAAGLGNAIHARFDRLGCELLTIVEADTLAQLEAPGVRRDKFP